MVEFNTAYRWNMGMRASGYIRPLDWLVLLPWRTVLVSHETSSAMIGVLFSPLS